MLLIGDRSQLKKMSGNMANKANKRTNTNKLNNNNRRRRVMRSNRRARRVARDFTQSQVQTLIKKEFWSTVSFTAGNTSQTHLNFDKDNGPAWFRKLCTLYEKFKIHWIKIELNTKGSAMTKGSVVLSYNTAYEARTTNKAQDLLLAQRGAKLIPAASLKGDIFIKGSGLNGYGTTLTCESTASSWAMDAVIASFVPPEDLTVDISITYKVSMINPQLN